MKLLLRRIMRGIQNISLGILYLWPGKHWRRRIEATYRAELDEQFLAWKQTQSDHCELCAHTRWAREKHGVELELTSHDCPDGTQFSLPEARMLQ